MKPFVPKQILKLWLLKTSTKIQVLPRQTNCRVLDSTRSRLLRSDRRDTRIQKANNLIGSRIAVQ